MRTDKILVSIACITYNHEKFIRDAIEGFLMQKTNFPIEIIIHDDASTDSTADIIREYEKKYPDLIKPIYQKENQYSKGIKPSQNFVWPKCLGKYIALCEGDDYWTDPYKLKKQVDFLESNPEFIMSFHEVKILNEKGITDDYMLKKRIPPFRDNFDTYDLSFGNFIHTCSVVFRNIKSVYIDNKVFTESKAGDYILHLYLSLHGKIKLHNDIMGVYRVHEGGIWSKKNDEYILSQKKHYLELLINNFKHESKKNFVDRYVFVLLQRMKQNLKKGNVNLVFKDFLEGLRRIEHFQNKLFWIIFKNKHFY